MFFALHVRVIHITSRNKNCDLYHNCWEIYVIPECLSSINVTVFIYKHTDPKYAIVKDELKLLLFLTI